jgi:hypothetical protein
MSLRVGKPASGAGGARRTVLAGSDAGARRRRRARRRTGAAAALLLAGTLAVAGCSASSVDSSDKAAGSAHSAPAPPVAGTGAVQDNGSGSTGASAPSSAKGGGKAPQLSAKYLVRTASLSVRTPHVADVLTQARALAASAGGYSGNENTEVDSAGHATSTVQLRVPPAAYESVLDDLAKLGTLLSRKVSVQDVTGQVVDVQSRVKSQQASVDRVRKLMDQATDLDDVVSLESELSTREAALESLEAQESSLAEQTNLATISLTLTEPPVTAAPHKEPKVAHDGFWTQVGHALRGGWHAFYLALRAVFVAVSAMLPFLAVVALLLVAYRVVRRRWVPRRVEPARVEPVRWGEKRFVGSEPLPRHPEEGAGEPEEDREVPVAPPMPRQAPRGGGAAGSGE